MSSALSAPASIVTMSVRPRAKHEPARLPSTGTIPRERSAGCPLLARHERARSPAAGTRTTAECAPRARRPPAIAAWATSPGVVAAASAELSWCRCWLRSRLTNSVSVSRARSTAWAAAPVIVKRKLWSGSEISRSWSQCTITAPMVWSDTTSGTMARARKRVDGERRGDVGPLPPQILERLREERDVVAQHRAVRPQRGEHPVDRARRRGSRSGAASAGGPARRCRAKVAASTRSSSRSAANTASATWAGSAAVVRARAIVCMR